MLSFLTTWLLTLSLVFGGCCSNALTLEQLTTEYPNSGSLVTFLQFIVIAIQGLPRHVTFTTKYFIPVPCLKPRHIPLRHYLAQVVLFYLLSMFNNLAFSYNIPMSVHIIFRSGGLAINMLMGRLISGKRYNSTQALSVVMITLGVILTTLSASNKPSSTSSPTNQYITGIGLLTTALVLSGFLGIVQDRTYAKFRTEGGSPWQESMFYLHFLSLPMFFSARNDILLQLHTLRASPPTSWSTSIPQSYIFLALNVFTQLLCVAGVNRLTSRVSSLTVTLILVVRKAVSLLISLLLFGDAGMDQSQKLRLWAGAALVFTGTVVYSIPRQKPKEKSN